MSNFITAIQQITPLSTSAQEAIAVCLQGESLPKKSVLLEQGAICKKIWFIDRGAARVFYYKDDKEVTDWIGLENAFILAIPSFFNQTPSRKAIELLEDSELTTITFESLEGLYASSHELERMGRLIGNFALTLMAARTEEVLFTTTAQRYQSLLSRHPDILQRVPLGVIASFLGMSQENLSRIRGVR